MRSYIYPNLPRTGLANMLFVWGRAEVESARYGIPILAPNWFNPFRIGPWLRREKDKRYYYSDFCNEGYITGIRKLIATLLGKRFPESELSYFTRDARVGVYTIEGQGECFRPMIGHEKEIKRALYRIISLPIRNNLEESSTEYIGVHIRRGDFTKIGQDIPVEWYVHIINSLKKTLFPDMPVRVFTDANKEEVMQVVAIPGVILMPRAPAIQDLLMLAESRVIVGTSLSTFSLWASFLNRRPTFWPPVSPGVHGYGLQPDHHVTTDWRGQFDIQAYEAARLYQI